MKYNILLALVFVSVILYAGIKEFDGIVGLTKLDGGIGCQCHWFEANDSVMVWIEGTDTVTVNDTVSFQLYMTGGPAINGGFNLAAYFGNLDSTDTLTQLELNTATTREELTHSLPNFFINDTVSWNFNYIAPDSILTDTLYATGNSCNGDSIPTELDQWNHAENFVVNVVDDPVNVNNKISLPEGFALYQNYPNPFNPVTTISYSIPTPPISSPLLKGRTKEGFVILKIYDVLGNEVATLVNEQLPAGEYEIEFNPNRHSRKGGNLTSGIYFYQLKVVGGPETSSGQGIVETKKMLLIK